MPDPVLASALSFSCTVEMANLAVVSTVALSSKLCPALLPGGAGDFLVLLEILAAILMALEINGGFFTITGFEGLKNNEETSRIFQKYKNFNFRR